MSDNTVSGFLLRSFVLIPIVLFVIVLAIAGGVTLFIIKRMKNKQAPERKITENK